MRCRIAVHDVIAFLDEVAFDHWDMFALGHHVLDFFQGLVRRLNGDPAFVFIVFSKPYISVDLCDDGVILGATRLEQFSHTRQTACDVLGLGTLARDTRDHVARGNVFTIFYRQNRIHRHRIGDRIARVIADRLAIFTNQNDLWFQIIALGGCPPIDDNFLCHARGIIGFIANSQSADQIHIFRGA